jgi:hypothetical protein
MSTALFTVVETGAFSARARGRMTATEVRDVIAIVAANPELGDLIQGTGGIRKLRFAVGGRGKSGGVRVVYYYHNDSMPVFLLTVFAKNEKANLTRAERNALAKVARSLRDGYGAR